MSTTSFSPKFVRANVSFRFNGTEYAVGEQLINSTGIPGFSWAEFNPAEHVGARVQVVARIHLGSSDWDLYCDALLTCEQRGAGLSLGMAFLLDTENRAKMDETVAQVGIHPDYVRKFPRMHYMEPVSLFPSRVLLRFFANGEDIIASADLENLSPTGIQIYTEDYRTSSITPGATVRAILQPRGSAYAAIPMNASVRAVITTIDPNTGNVRRYFGLAITGLSLEAKVIFADLLRQIVIQAKAAAAKKRAA